MPKRKTYHAAGAQGEFSPRTEKCIDFFIEKAEPPENVKDKEAIKEKKIIKKITKLDNNGYKLLEPFLVKFSFENNELIGEIKELELYAFGKSEIEIMNELKLDIIDLYEYYSEFEDNELGKDPLKWKKVLLKKIVHGR